ncbi:EamA family transporter [Ktedonosporobacter rubrisoli]|uniref:EamA family transporter n=1 Tax=Ktedonosporobacter rubrisoli TaxID=2509675 RepID=A0A4P6K0E1_KTERU|nr:EamA family transporter [Ktedonosporobacter rubrisoli]QBD80866.1 EamA family transporter [Ktedonosporobacter rubrisoli]
MSARNTSRRDFWLIVCAAISWGTTGIANQAIYAHTATNASSLAFWRLAIAVPLFLGACGLLLGWRRFLQVKPRDAGIMVLMGGMQGLSQFGYSAAIPYAGVTVSTLIAISVAPVLVAVFSTLIARERPRFYTVIALVTALCGLFLLVEARSQPGTGNVSLPGIALSFLSACGYAGFLLSGHIVSSRYHPLHVSTIAFSVGALFLLLLSLPGGLVVSYGWRDWLILLYLGCVPTALAYGLFQFGMRSLSATVVSIVTLCEPLTAALLAWLLFHEELGLLGLLGAVLMLGAMLLILLTSTSSK